MQPPARGAVDAQHGFESNSAPRFQTMDNQQPPRTGSQSRRTSGNITAKGNQPGLGPRHHLSPRARMHLPLPGLANGLVLALHHRLEYAGLHAGTAGFSGIAESDRATATRVPADPSHRSGRPVCRHRISPGTDPSPNGSKHEPPLRLLRQRRRGILLRNHQDGTQTDARPPIRTPGNLGLYPLLQPAAATFRFGLSFPDRI